MGRLLPISLLVIAWSLIVGCGTGPANSASAPAEPEVTNARIRVTTKDDVEYWQENDLERWQPDEEEEGPDEAVEPYKTVFMNAGGELLCPVMEVILDSEDVAEGFQDYKGVRYWFSTVEAAAMFHENPEKFAK